MKALLTARGIVTMLLLSWLGTVPVQAQDIGGQVMLVKGFNATPPSVAPGLQAYRSKLASPPLNQFNSFQMVDRRTVRLTPTQTQSTALGSSGMTVDLTASQPDASYVPVQVRWRGGSRDYVNMQVRLRRGRSSPFAAAGPPLEGGTAILMIEAE